MNLWAENNIIVEYVGKTDAFCWQAFYVVIREFFLRPNLFYHWLLLRNGQRFSFLRCTGGWYQNWISRLCWEDGYVLDVVPFPVTVTTTKIITFSVGDPYKPFCTTVTGRGPHPRYVLYPLIAKLWTFDMLGHGTAAGTCWQNYEAYLGAAKLVKCWRDIL